MKPIEISLSATAVEKQEIELALLKERHEAAREKLPILTKALRLQKTQKGRSEYRLKVRKLNQRIRSMQKRIRQDQVKLRQKKRKM